jgi:hypothetical protein
VEASAGLMGCLRQRCNQMGRFDGMFEGCRAAHPAGLMGCLRLANQRTGRFDGMFEGAHVFSWAGLMGCLRKTLGTVRQV